MVGSFLLQGHTVSEEPRLALAALLFVHLTAVHWWLGALHPLSLLTRRGDPSLATATVAAFSARAVWVVAALLTAGVALALTLTGAELRPSSPYQQRLLVKLVLVAAILAIAAWNKMRLVPLLEATMRSAPPSCAPPSAGRSQRRWPCSWPRLGSSEWHPMPDTHSELRQRNCRMVARNRPVGQCEAGT